MLYSSYCNSHCYCYNKQFTISAAVVVAFPHQNDAVVSFPSSKLATSSSSSSSSSSPLRLKMCTPITKVSDNNQLDELNELDDDDAGLNRFVEVGNQLADAAREIINKYFRKKFEILDKDDLSPVTVADQLAEDAMVFLILQNFPDHAM
ncbi:hypothetical protein ACFE04_016487 [Oxalis oulophora]